MSKPQYIYVTCFGGLWRLTPRRAAAYKDRRERHVNEDVNLDDYGVQLTDRTFEVTDTTEDLTMEDLRNAGYNHLLCGNAYRQAFEGKI